MSSPVRLLQARCFILFFAAVIASSARAQGNSQAGTLSLDSAVSEGARNSPTVQRAEASSRAADWQRVGALSGFLPSVSASGTHYFDQKYSLSALQIPGFGAPGTVFTIPGVVPQTTMIASAQLPLFDGFANINHYAAAKALSSAADLDYDWTKFQVEEDIRLKFYQALAAQKLASVADENVKTIEDHLNNTKLLKRGGVSTNFDVLRTEVQMSEAQSDRVQAQDNVAITRQVLNEAMGLDTDNRELVGDLPVPPLGLVDNVTMPDPRDRKDVRALELRQRASSKESAAADAFWVPKISAIGSFTEYSLLVWSGQTTYGGNPDAYRNAYQIGVQLTWNLFDGMRSIASSREAAAHEVEAEKTLRIAQLKMPTDFAAYRRRYDYASSLYRSRLVNVERANESVRLATVGYKAGVRINSEVLDSQLELFRARAGVVSSQLAAAESVINLELATGRPVSFPSTTTK